MTDTAQDEYLRIDHLSGDLRTRSVRGGVVVLVVQATQFVANLVATAILARLLMPADFGLVSMATAVTGFLTLFLDMGLGSAVIQQAVIAPRQMNALFWINAGLGVLISAAAIALAPAIAWFYGKPELIGITAVLAVNFVVSGASLQHSALLRRQMRFSVTSAIDLGSLIAGICVAVIAARRGFGYWSLVAQQVTQQITAAGAAWIACGWRPGRPQRAAGMRGILRFGTGLTHFNVLNYLSRNVDNVIIGRFAGEAALGLYLKSYSLLLLPIDRVRAPASAVVVPALSRLQDAPDRFKRYFLHALTSVAAIGMPAVVFLFVFAEDAILLVLGPKWRQSILLFRILAPAAFVESFNTVGSWACLPFGRSQRLATWQTIATATTLSAFFVGVHWGVVGVAAAFTTVTIALRGPALWYLLRGAPVGPAAVLSSLCRPACAAIFAGYGSFLVRARIGAPPGSLTMLLAGATAYAALYCAGWLIVPGGRRALQELLSIRRDLMPRPSVSQNRHPRHHG